MLKQIMRRKYGVNNSDDSESSMDTPSESSSEESDGSWTSNRSKVKLRSSDKRSKKQTNKSQPKKKSKQYVSSSSEHSSDNEVEIIDSDSEDDFVVNRKTRKRPSNVLLSASDDSGVDDRRKDSDLEEDLNNEIQTNDDEIVFLESIPASRSTIRPFIFKPPDNGFSSSNTMSSLDISSNSEEEPVDTIVATDPIFQQISKKLTEKLKEQLSEKSPEKLVKERIQSVPTVPQMVSLNIPKTIESVPTVEPQLPKSVAVPHIRPPIPQLPTSSPGQITILTPRTKPYATTKWKQGQAIHIPAPPQMPPILHFKVMSAIETLKAIKKRLSNDCEEIETIDQTLKISLNCPITNKRCVLPSRSIKCHHFDCFDINAFLEINFNHKIEDWKCPKCKQPATDKLLIIDSLLQHILTHKDVDPSVESVIFDSTALWVPDIKLPENSVHKTGDSNVINVLDNTAEEVIDLVDDDDDDEEIPPLPTPQASVPIPSKPTVNIVNAELAVAAAKFVEKNISNHLSQTNRNKTPVLTPVPTQPIQCRQSGNNYQIVSNNNEFVLMMGSTQQQPSVQRNNRWSTGPTVSLNPPQLIQPTNVATNRTTTAPNPQIARQQITFRTLNSNVTQQQQQQNNLQQQQQNNLQQQQQNNLQQQQQNNLQQQQQNNLQQQRQLQQQTNLQQQQQQRNTTQQVAYQPQLQPQPTRPQPQILNRQQFISMATPQTTPQQTVINRTNSATNRTVITAATVTTGAAPSNQSAAANCDFRFTLGHSGQMVVYCPSCNESFNGTQELVEAHKKSAQHIAKSNKSNTTTTANRADTQTTRTQTNPQTVNNNRNNNNKNNNNTNTNRNSRPIAPSAANNQNQRPTPLRTYSNQYYNNDPNGYVWNGYQQFTSYNPNSLPYNFVTNNYNYPQTYVQQVTPSPAHTVQPSPVTGPPQAHTNPVYSTHQMANQNQPNFY